MSITVRVRVLAALGLVAIWFLVGPVEPAASQTAPSCVIVTPTATPTSVVIPERCPDFLEPCPPEIIDFIVPPPPPIFGTSTTAAGPAPEFPPAPQTGGPTPPANCELVRPIRADTGAGGSGGRPPMVPFLLAAGGLLALAAAFGIHRASGGHRS